MKKIMKILLAAAIFAGTVMMTGCGFGERIRETYNTWYQYNREGGLDIPIGTDDNSEDMSGAQTYLENAEFYVYFDADDGLTVVVQSTKKENIELYGGALSTSVDVVAGGKKQYPKERFGAGSWTALMVSGAFDECSEPMVSKNPDKCIQLFGEDKTPLTIQWKKILKNYLINLVFPEI